MGLTIGNITLDCDDPRTVSAFWSAALGRPVDEGGSEFFCSIGVATDERPRWLFLKVPESKTAKNRLHLDLEAEDRQAEVERLVGLGATVQAEKAEWGHEWTVLEDPEGNEFCVAGVWSPGDAG